MRFATIRIVPLFDFGAVNNQPKIAALSLIRTGLPQDFLSQFLLIFQTSMRRGHACFPKLHHCGTRTNDPSARSKSHHRLLSAVYNLVKWSAELESAIWRRLRGIGDVVGREWQSRAALFTAGIGKAPSVSASPKFGARPATQIFDRTRCQSETDLNAPRVMEVSAAIPSTMAMTKTIVPGAARASDVNAGPGQ